MFVAFVGVLDFMSIGVVRSFRFSCGCTNVAAVSLGGNSRIDPRLLSNTLELGLMARYLLALEEFPSSRPLSGGFMEDGPRILSEMKVTDLQSA